MGLLDEEIFDIDAGLSQEAGEGVGVQSKTGRVVANVCEGNFRDGPRAKQCGAHIRIRQINEEDFVEAPLPDQFGRQRLAGDRKVFNGALGLRAVVSL